MVGVVRPRGGETKVECVCVCVCVLRIGGVSKLGTWAFLM